MILYFNFLLRFLSHKTHINIEPGICPSLFSHVKGCLYFADLCQQLTPVDIRRSGGTFLLYKIELLDWICFPV